MSNSNIEIFIFEITDTVFESLGVLNAYSSLIWNDSFASYSSFELHAPITEENKILLKEDRVLWKGGESAGIIKSIQANADEHGNRTFYIKGVTLNFLLTSRIVWDTYNAYNKYASTILYDLVKRNCIDTVNPNRKIPWLEVEEVQPQFGERITFQKTGGEVHDACRSIANTGGIGFNIKFDHLGKRLIFVVEESIDRTINQTERDSIIFSTDLDDILSSSYYTNSQDEKNIALVLGEGEGIDRKAIVSGEGESFGLLRKEMSVDARDLQSVYTDEETGDEVELSEEEYEAVLTQRGDEKLSEFIKIETFDAKIKSFGDSQYTFNEDYKKGDKVTVIDEQLNVTVSAMITEVQETYSDTYGIYLTFGYSYPTIMDKMTKQNINIIR